MGFTIDTSEVAKNLKVYQENLERELSVAVTNTIKWIVSKAQETAPVKSGWLRSQIKPGIIKATNQIIAGEVVSTAAYSLFVEFGTSDRRARAFLRPALKQSRKVLEKEINSAFRRAGRR